MLTLHWAYKGQLWQNSSELFSLWKLWWFLLHSRVALASVSLNTCHCASTQALAESLKLLPTDSTGSQTFGFVHFECGRQKVCPSTFSFFCCFVFWMGTSKVFQTYSPLDHMGSISNTRLDFMHTLFCPFNKTLYLGSWWKCIIFTML